MQMYVLFFKSSILQMHHIDLFTNKKIYEFEVNTDLLVKKRG